MQNSKWSVLSPSWSSLDLWKGHFLPSQKGHQQNRQEVLLFRGSKVAKQKITFETYNSSKKRPGSSFPKTHQISGIGILMPSVYGKLKNCCSAAFEFVLKTINNFTHMQVIVTYGVSQCWVYLHVIHRNTKCIPSPTTNTGDERLVLKEQNPITKSQLY